MMKLRLKSTVEPAFVVRHARAARRLRLDVPSMLGEPSLGERIAAELRRYRGVETVVSSARTGRVLVCYGPGCTLLNRLEPESPAGGPRPSALRVVRRPMLAWFGGPGPLTRPGRQSSIADPWHALAVEVVLRRLGTSAIGLDPSEAARRLAASGPNVLSAPEERSRLDILLDQVSNLPTWLLLGSSAVSGALRDLFDAGAILTAVGLNTAIGYRIERTNEDLLASWRKLEAGEAHVMRRGVLQTVPAAEVVVGDVLLCREGDTVPADARVIDAHRLACNEAALTGESEPQTKSTAPVGERTVLAERQSMIYAGMVVVSGHGRAVVTATAAGTEVARVGQLLAEQQAPRTPLERRLTTLGNQLAVGGMGAGIAAAVAGLLHRRPFGQAMRNGVALGVAAIPEGLPVVSTAALVRTMQRMRRRGMVVRRLVSAETLGGVTVVCADKTGTLTQNDMVVEILDLGGGRIDPATVRVQPDRLFDDGPTLALAAAALNSDVDVQRTRKSVGIAGSATERALVAAAAAAGLDRSQLRRLYPRRLLRERDHGVHYVVSLHDAPAGGRVAFVKGAPEQVLAMCDRDLRRRLTPGTRRRMRDRNDALAADGLRVLALGWRRLPAADEGVPDRGYTLIGLVGLRDPLRPGAADAVRAAARAGIRTVILTGDQRRTAEAIARAVGLEGETVDGEEAARVLRGDGAALRRRLGQIAVFSRVAPADKVAIVQALRAGGEIVAMAGDGVNDAPALKAADVGIAIGIRSSDVARQAADVVLENEDLRSILSAVGEGRIVQDNLRRAIAYLLATNLSEVLLSVGAAVLGARDPFTPLQLLWINLLSDTFPALALALEPGRPDVLDRAPAPPDAPLVSAAAQRRILRDGALLSGLGAASLAVGGPPLVFATIGGAELGYAFACRSTSGPMNGRFGALVGGAIALQVAALGVSPLRRLLGLPGAASPLEIAGFVAGLAIPWLASATQPSEVIVRRGVEAQAAFEAPDRTAGRPGRKATVSSSRGRAGRLHASATGVLHAEVSS